MSSRRPGAVILAEVLGTRSFVPSCGLMQTSPLTLWKDYAPGITDSQASNGRLIIRKVGSPRSQKCIAVDIQNPPHLRDGEEVAPTPPLHRVAVVQPAYTQLLGGIDPDLHLAVLALNTHLQQGTQSNDFQWSVSQVVETTQVAHAAQMLGSETCPWAALRYRRRRSSGRAKSGSTAGPACCTYPPPWGPTPIATSRGLRRNYSWTEHQHNKHS